MYGEAKISVKNVCRETNINKNTNVLKGKL